MSLARVQQVIAAWLLLVIIPAGILAVVPSPEGTVLGVILGLMLVAWIAQWGLFLWLMREFDSMDRIVWAIWASVGTQATYASARTVYFGITGLVTVAVAVWMYLAITRRLSLAANGVVADAVVLEVLSPKFWNVVINNVYIRRTVRLQVHAPDGKAFEARIKDEFMLGAIPSEGSHVQVVYDAADREDIMLVKKAAWMPARDSAQSTGQPARGATTHTVADDLERLVAMRRDGDLTDEEFAHAKSLLLSG